MYIQCIRHAFLGTKLVLLNTEQIEYECMVYNVYTCMYLFDISSHHYLKPLSTVYIKRKERW